MKIALASDIGRIRETNEDNFFVDENIGLFIATDGMGGHQAGEVASEIAVNVIAAFIRENLASTFSTTLLIKQSISMANHEVFSTSCGDACLKGMGTTVVLALFENESKIHIANVGDSRAYLICGDKIRQLTKDHTLIGDLVERGEIPKEDARGHPIGHMITKAVGISEDVEADINTIDVEKGCYILLCTDGLTDMLSDVEIRNIIAFRNGSVDGKCRELIRWADEKGGRDNITAILIQV